MNQLVELERVKLAGVKPYKPLPDMFEKQSELLLVIAPDQLARRPALSTITSPLAAFVHATDPTSSPNA